MHAQDITGTWQGTLQAGGRELRMKVSNGDGGGLKAVTFAYGIHARQVTNGSEWMERDKYDLTARPDGEGQPNDKQSKAMVQKLLADRFKLAFHRDKKELPVLRSSLTRHRTS